MNPLVSTEQQIAERQKQALELALRFRTYDSLEIRCSDEACFLVVNILGTPAVLGDGSGEAKAFRHDWQIREWLHSRFEIVLDRPANEDYRHAPRNTAARAEKDARRQGARMFPQRRVR